MNPKSVVARCALIVFIVAGLLVPACNSGPAKPRVYKIGVLNLLPAMETVINGFKAAMTEAGYKEGDRVTYIYPGAAGAPDKLAAQAKDLVSQKVDFIFAVTTPAAQAARDATATSKTPVIFAGVTDPVKDKLIQSLVRPGDNLTGILQGVPGGVHEGRRLELFLQMVPNAKRIYVPYNPADAIVVESLAVVKQSAAKLNIQIDTQEIKDQAQVDAAVQALPKGIDGIMVLGDRLVAASIDKWAASASAQRVPISAPNVESVSMGAVMAYGSGFEAMGKQAARLAVQVLKGVKPADLPTEAPDLLLALNVKSATQIGLNIPDPILRQAQVVIR